MNPNDPNAISPNPVPPTQPVAPEQPVMPAQPGVVMPQAVPPVQPGMPQTPVAPMPAPNPVYNQPVGAPVPGQFGPQPAYQQPMAASQGMGKSSSKLPIIIIGVVVAVLVLGGVGFAMSRKSGGGGGNIVGKLTGGGVKLKAYTDNDMKFSINAPDGWKTTTDTSTTFKSISFAEPASDVKDTSEAAKYSGILSIFEDTYDSEYIQPKDAADYIDTSKKYLKEEIDDQNSLGGTATQQKLEVVEEKAVTVNGLSAYQVKMKVTNYLYKEGKIGYEYRLFVYAAKDRQYDIRLSAHESEKDILNKANDILTSFKAL